jgi:hypothetical protein
VREPFIKDVLNELGADPADLTGERALTAATVDHLRRWLAYDLRPFVFRRLSRNPPQRFQIDRVGPDTEHSAEP